MKPLQRAVALGLVHVVLCAAGCGPDTFQPEYVDRVALSPDSVHLAVGESAVFEAMPLDPQGEPFPDRADRVVWSHDPVRLEVSEEGAELRVRALALGTARVSAVLGRGSSEGQVFVSPPGLERIAIFQDKTEVTSTITFVRPDPVQSVRAELTARLFAADGSELSPQGFRISWSSNSDDATILAGGVGPIASLLVGGLNRPGRIRLTVSGRSIERDFLILTDGGAIGSPGAWQLLR